jgi:signal transduction histidine kinase
LGHRPKAGTKAAGLLAESGGRIYSSVEIVYASDHRDLRRKMAMKEEIDQEREHGKKLRRVLLAAFGGLLTLMVVAGMESFRSMQRLDALERQANQQYAAHSKALLMLVISVHAYNAQVERFLMPEEGPESRPTADEVAQSAARASVAVQRYPEDQDAQERQLLRKIAEHLADQQNSFVRVSTWQPAERKRSGVQFLTTEMIPHRTYVLQVSQEMASINTQRLDEANMALATRYAGLRSRMAMTLTVSLAAGLLLSLVGGIYILRLEQQGRRRYEALAKSRRELEELSAQMESTQEAERRNISRELHDEVGQTLGVLLLEVGRVAKLAPASDQIMQQQIARVKSTAETAVKAIRDIALLLRPPMLDDLGLIPALEWQAREVSRRSDLEVTVDAQDMTEQPSDELKVCIYRLVQEALNNAATHSGAKNAKVTVVRDADRIIVRVEDDGRGFDPTRTRGMGLLGMEERVRRSNGLFSIRSAPSKGTTLTAELPMSHAEKV